MGIGLGRKKLKRIDSDILYSDPSLSLKVLHTGTEDLLKFNVTYSGHSSSLVLDKDEASRVAEAMAKFADVDVFVLTASEVRSLQVILKMFIKLGRDFQDVEEDILTQETVAKIQALAIRFDQLDPRR